MKTFLFALLPYILIFSQESLEQDLDSAFINMKKGIYFALSNIDPAKSSISRELISENKLISQVKLSKEIDGVKIESTGYFNSAEMTVKLYRSQDFLLREGYIKSTVPDEPEKKKKKKRDL